MYFTLLLNLAAEVTYILYVSHHHITFHLKPPHCLLTCMAIDQLYAAEVIWVEGRLLAGHDSLMEVKHRLCTL